MSEYTPKPSKKPEELAAQFGARTLAAIQGNEPVDVVFWCARLAATFGHTALEAKEQEARNRQHQIEIDRAFQTLTGQRWFSLQEVADQKLTDYLNAADAHLGAVES